VVELAYAAIAAVIAGLTASFLITRASRLRPLTNIVIGIAVVVTGFVVLAIWFIIMSRR
jgi:hypothetical protein